MYVPTNETSINVDTWVKIIGEILLFISIIFAIIKYSQERKRDFQKRFFEEQLKIYSEAVSSASIISTHDKNQDEYKKAVLNFKSLYTGKMCIIEDKDVESRMIQFNRVLDVYEKHTRN